MCVIPDILKAVFTLCSIFSLLLTLTVLKPALYSLIQRSLRHLSFASCHICRISKQSVQICFAAVNSETELVIVLFI